MPDRFDISPEIFDCLLAKVLLGDKQASEQLVSLLAPVIRRVAGRVKPVDVREDMIQEVWTRLWSKNCRVLQKWNRTDPLVHYVAVVASNLIKDRLGKRDIGTKPLDERSDPPDPDDLTLAVEVRQLAECIEKAKARLSHMHRELIHMRHELGMKHREIANKLERTIGYVGGTLARAERYLCEELMEACAEHLADFRSIFRN